MMVELLFCMYELINGLVYCIYECYNLFQIYNLYCYCNLRLIYSFTPTVIIALHCIALHCIALHCIALHCIAVQCSAVQCSAVQCIAFTYTGFIWLYCNEYVNVPILDATVNELCQNAVLNCAHGCRLKSGITGTTGHTTNDVECFCNDGYKLDTNTKTCVGTILVAWIK